MLAAAAILAAAPVPSALPQWQALTTEATAALMEEGVTAADFAKLTEGAILTQRRETPAGKAGVRVAAFGIIRASAEAIFEAVADCGRLPEFMPHFVACADVTPDRPLPPNERWNENRLAFGIFPAKIKLRIVQHAVLEPPFKLSWQRVSGDTKESAGYWRIIPLGGGFHVLAYDTLTDPGSAVPNWLQRMLTESDLPGTVEAVRKRVEKTVE